MKAQALTDLATANWAIAVAIGIGCMLLAIIGFLLTRILNRIESKQESHDMRITEVERDVAVLFDRR